MSSLIILMILLASVSRGEAKLDLSAFRLGRQFDNAGSEDSNGVAIGLIEALQRWADALETQISLMHGEVLTLKADNRRTSVAVGEIKSENEDRDQEIERLEANLAALSGNTEQMSSKLHLLTTSLTSFIDRVSDQTENLFRNTTSLSSDYRDLSQKVDNHDRDIRFLNRSSVSIDSFSSTLVNLTDTVYRDISSVRSDSKGNLSSLAVDLAAVKNSLRTSLQNTTAALGTRIRELESAKDELSGNMEALFAKDIELENLIERAEGKYERIKTWASEFEEQLNVHFDARDNFTRAALVALADISDGISRSQSDVKQLNSSLLTAVGSLRGEIQDVSDRLEEDIRVVNLTMAENSFDLQKLNISVVRNKRDIIQQHASLDYVQGNLKNLSVNELVKIRKNLELIELQDVQVRNRLGGVAKDLGSLQEYYVNLKREIFENKLLIVNFNVSLNTLGILGEDLRSVSFTLGNESSSLRADLDLLSTASEALYSEIKDLRNISQNLKEEQLSLSENVTAVAGNLNDFKTETIETQRKIIEAVASSKNRTDVFERGLGSFLNRTLFPLKERVLGLERGIDQTRVERDSLQSTLNNKISKLYEIQSDQIDRVTEQLTLTKGNISRIHDNFGRSLTNFEDKLEILKTVLYTAIETAERTEKQVQVLGLEGSKMNGRIEEIVKQNAVNKIRDVSLRLEKVRNKVSTLALNQNQLTDRMNEHEEKFVKNVTDLRQNVVRLGDVINDIGGDLDQFVKNDSTLSGDFTLLRKATADIQTKMDLMDFVHQTLREDIGKISNRLNSMKNSNENLEDSIKVLKAGSEEVTVSLIKLNDSIEKNELLQRNADRTVAGIRTDLLKLRTALTSLTNTIFTLKTRFSASSASEIGYDDSFHSSSNLSSIARDVVSLRNEMDNEIKPDIEIVSSDMSNLKQFMNNIMKQVGGMLDPARFSCAVTSDEIRTAGVITYSVCNVNSADMMNKNNGHVTIREAGDYFLSFTANMVSVNSQAIWCALYKQSPGSDGWQVLGMINNYQRDAASEDDRDSASLTLIAGLEAGDQIWVEWRGYGESFLYSNPYKLINFTGLLVKRNV